MRPDLGEFHAAQDVAISVPGATYTLSFYAASHFDPNGLGSVSIMYLDSGHNVISSLSTYTIVNSVDGPSQDFGPQNFLYLGPASASAAFVRVSIDLDNSNASLGSTDGTFGTGFADQAPKVDLMILTQTVPEASSVLLSLTGLAGLLARRRRA